MIVTTHRATGLEVVVDGLVIPPYTLEVTFDHGVVRRIDLEPELSGDVFEPLKDPQVFAQVTVDQEAGTVVWPNGADLAPEFLYEAGTKISP